MRDLIGVGLALLGGDIGVQEWVSYVSSAEELSSDLALATAARPRQ